MKTEKTEQAVTLLAISPAEATTTALGKEGKTRSLLTFTYLTSKFLRCTDDMEVEGFIFQENPCLHITPSSQLH